MSSILAFSSLGNNVTIAATTASANGALPGPTDVAASVRVLNSSAAVAFVKFGTSSGVVAAATDTFLAPGATETFNIPVGITHVAAILSTGTGTVYVERGGGL